MTDVQPTTPQLTGRVRRFWSCHVESTGKLDAAKVVMLPARGVHIVNGSEWQARHWLCSSKRAAWNYKTSFWYQN